VITYIKFVLTNRTSNNSILYLSFKNANMTFCKKNNAKIILLIIFCVFIIISLFLYQTVNLQNTKIYMSTYEHISYIKLYMFIYIYILLSIYFYIKKFLPGNIINFFVNVSINVLTLSFLLLSVLLKS